VAAFVLQGQFVETTTIALLVNMFTEALKLDPKQALVGEIVPLVSERDPE